MTENKKLYNARSITDGELLFMDLARRLIKRIFDAADMSLPDATNIELSLARIIAERDRLRSTERRNCDNEFGKISEGIANTDLSGL